MSSYDRHAGCHPVWRYDGHTTLQSIDSISSLKRHIWLLPSIAMQLLLHAKGQLQEEENSRCIPMHSWQQRSSRALADTATVNGCSWCVAACHWQAQVVTNLSYWSPSSSQNLTCSNPRMMHPFFFFQGLFQGQRLCQILCGYWLSACSRQGYGASKSEGAQMAAAGRKGLWCFALQSFGEVVSLASSSNLGSTCHHPVTVP